MQPPDPPRDGPAGAAPPRPLPPRRRLRLPGRAVTALVLREIATAHGRAPGGYLWAVAEPVAGIALLTAVFAVSFHAPALGTSFALFYASGLLPFLMFTDISGKLAQALNFSRPLFAYPSVGFLDALLARFALAALTQVAVICLILGLLLFRGETRATPDAAILAQGFGLVAALGFGAGAMNCLLQGLTRIWQRLWAIAMRPMFLVSGVFFTYESVPHPWQELLWWNPLIHAVGIVRRGLYPGYEADYAEPLYLAGLALGLTALALAGLTRWHRDILADG